MWIESGNEDDSHQMWWNRKQVKMIENVEVDDMLSCIMWIYTTMCKALMNVRYLETMNAILHITVKCGNTLDGN